MLSTVFGVLKHLGQVDGSAGNGACCQAWLFNLPSLGHTWWKLRTDSHPDLHTCAVAIDTFINMCTHTLKKHNLKKDKVC